MVGPKTRRQRLSSEFSRRWRGSYGGTWNASSSEAPAADRVVRLDHNSSTYREAIDALERLERVLTEANDYPDAEDKEQKVAEVSAAGRIFRATRVRVGVVVSLLAVPVTYLVKTFAGAAIGEAATKVIDALTSLLGAIF